MRLSHVRWAVQRARPAAFRTWPAAKQYQVCDLPTLPTSPTYVKEAATPCAALSESAYFERLSTTCSGITETDTRRTCDEDHMRTS